MQPSSPFYLFVPQNVELLGEYEQGWKVTDAFAEWGSGVKTNRDHFLVALDKGVLTRRILDMLNDGLDDESFRLAHRLEDGRYWNTKREREKVRNNPDYENQFLWFLYRPFDKRWIYYQPNLIEIGRGGASKGLMHHILAGENVGMLLSRRVVSEFRHAFVSKNLTNVNATDTAGMFGSGPLFPLYLYPDPHELDLGRDRRPNLSPAFLKALAEKLNLPQIRPHGLPEGVTPEDIFHYAYAVFHSPTYRKRYAEFLKRDFPRLPLTSDVELFRSLAGVGGELVALHLMESPLLDDLITHYPAAGSDEVVKVTYVEQDRRVYINQDQYFAGVPPEVWEFQVGGYQVCGKWLKDRKGRALSYDDQKHYHRIVVALKETIQRMEDIDKIIPSWPIQ